MERWKPIEGWSLYDISDHGNVRSWCPTRHERVKRKLAPVPKSKSVTSTKYYTITMHISDTGRVKTAKTFYVHRLVAQAFVDGDKSLHVAHLDGSRTNNHYTNLKWCTRKENMSHMIEHGTKQFGESHKCAKLCNHAVIAIHRLRKVGISIVGISKLFDVSHPHVSNIINRNYRKDVAGDLTVEMCKQCGNKSAQQFEIRMDEFGFGKASEGQSVSDPKLKEAMAEIFGVLKKHDVAGQVVLVSPSHSEFRIKIDPTWSCAFFEEREKGVAIRFRATRALIPDKEKRHKTAELTMHILCQLRDLNAQYFVGLEGMIKSLSEHMDIEHIPYSGYEPHREN